ncbi:MAG: protein kinase [Steroidobacteraceae bacterium]|nr:protein kinase [Nevskiaceae bacterium]MCP5471022.1 protein kinase [Nevskiaceae bacterium]
MLTLEKGAELCGRFTLIERIGTGGQGEVWRAHDATRHEDVALKVLHPEVARSPEAWESLRHEYAVAQRLGHPGIVEIAEPVRDDAATVLPMTLATGDLRRLRGEPYTRIVPALLEIARALDHAHSRGVIHRDLKPSNVLIDVEGHINVSDFGMAALDGEVPNTGFGSPFSASPQQIEGEPPAPADDVYGLGALAYELLSGYPPYYPDFDARAVIGAPVPDLQPIHAAPPRLVRLVMRMLAKDPAERPASMDDLQEELHAALQDTVSAGETAPPPPPLDSDDDTATSLALRVETDPALELPAVQPLEHEPLTIGFNPESDVPAAAAPLPEQGRDELIETDAELESGSIEPAEAAGGSRRVSVLKWAGLAALAAALIGVFVFLPRIAEQRAVQLVPPPVADQQDSAPPSAAEPPPAAAGTTDVPQQFAELRTGFDTRLAALEQRAAAVWGGAAFAGAKALGTDAVAALAAGNVEIAFDRIKVATRRLERLATEAGAALQSQLEAGERALAAGQIQVARQAFELALQIEPGNARATAGLVRSGGLAPVLPAFAEAESALAAGDAARAAELYEQVLKADPQHAAATAGLRRARAAVSDEAYARQIGDALASLRAGRHAEARRALEQARALRPEAPEVAAGFAELASAVAGRDLAGAQARGAQLEAAERWDEALLAYEGVLAGDPGVEFARIGRERVLPRVELARGLQGLIDKPERLAADEVRAEAASLLDRARGLANPGPLLRAQISQVEAQLPRYDRPIRVALESDGLTSIAIQRVGTLGSFARQEVELKPGRYVVIGTRAGYRDVRHEILIAPGEAPRPIQVRCVDPI